MKIAILGGMGMLGKAITTALVREPIEASQTVLTYSHGSLDILDDEALMWALRDFDIGYDVVINCAGTPNQASRVNIDGPHILAKTYKGKIIHISTDCVFDGKREIGSSYSIHDVTNATDPYGASKAVGECGYSHVTNIRTSFIGPEHGLLAWFLNNASQGKDIPAWTDAWWSGSSVLAVAKAIRDCLFDGEKLHNIEHLATAEPINKAEALRVLADGFGIFANFERTDEPYINRVLEPSLPALPALFTCVSDLVAYTRQLQYA